MWKLKKRGFTAIEILFAIGILGIIMAIIVPSFSNFRKASLINTETQDIVSFINKSRLSSMSSKADLTYGVHFDSNKVVVFSTPTYSAVESTNETRMLNSLLYFAGTQIEGGGSDVVFQKVTGSTNKYATTTLKFVGTTATSTTFVIRPSGVVIAY
ncbi:MAG: type II secretion system protein [Patescibacteria group bacterium]